MLTIKFSSFICYMNTYIHIFLGTCGKYVYENKAHASLLSRPVRIKLAGISRLNVNWIARGNGLEK